MGDPPAPATPLWPRFIAIADGSTVGRPSAAPADAVSALCDLAVDATEIERGVLAGDWAAEASAVRLGTGDAVVRRVAVALRLDATSVGTVGLADPLACDAGAETLRRATPASLAWIRDC